MFLHIRPPNLCFCPDITAWTATWHSPKTSPEIYHPRQEQSRKAVATRAPLDGSHCWWGPRGWLLVSCLSIHACHGRSIKIERGVAWGHGMPGCLPQAEHHHWPRGFLVYQPVMLFLISMSAQQARLGFWGPFWAEQTSFLPWQGSWKLLELVQYHIVSNTEVSAAVLPAPSARARTTVRGYCQDCRHEYQEKELLPLKSSYLWAYSAKINLLVFRKNCFFHPPSKPLFFMGGCSSPPQSLLWGKKERSDCILNERLCLYHLTWSLPA